MNAPFLLFAGEDFYPAPAWDEFRGAFPTQEAASLAVHEARIPIRGTPEEWEDEISERIHWYQIVDVTTLSLVEFGGRGYGGDDRPGKRAFKGYTLTKGRS